MSQQSLFSVPGAHVHIVGIGASAGGLGPLKELIGALPPRPGLALIVVQHLDPHRESRLVDLLRPHTGMNGMEASDSYSMTGPTSFYHKGNCHLRRFELERRSASAP